MKSPDSCPNSCLFILILIKFVLKCQATIISPPDVFTDPVPLPNGYDYQAAKGINHVAILDFSIVGYRTPSLLRFVNLTSRRITYYTSIQTVKAYKFETALDNTDATDKQFICWDSANLTSIMTGNTSNKFRMDEGYMVKVLFGDNNTHVILADQQGFIKQLGQYQKSYLITGRQRILDIYYLKSKQKLYIFTSNNRLLMVRKQSQMFDTSNVTSINLAWQPNSTVSISDRYLAISLQNVIKVYQSQTLQFLFDIAISGAACQLQIVSQCLFYINSGVVYQLNIFDRSVISTAACPISGPNIKMHHFDNQRSLVVYALGQLDYYVFEINHNYYCGRGCLSCQQGYTMQPDRECIPNPIVNPIVNPHIQKSSDFTNNTYYQKIKKASSFTMFSALMRIALHFYVPLFIFIEDIWPYQFHKGIKYPYFMQLCSKEASFFEEFKLEPAFMQNITIKSSISRYLSHKSAQLDQYGRCFYQEQCGLDGFGSLWISTSLDFLLWGIVISFAFFVVFGICYRLASQFCNHDKNSMGFKIIEIFRNRTRKWVLVMLLMQSGILRISLSTFNQLAFPMSTRTLEKISFAGCTVFAFFILMYCCCFYALVKKYHTRSSKILLKFSKGQSRKGFILEASIVVIYKFTRGFVHSSLIQHYATKLALLLGLDLLQIGIYIIARKCFLKKYFLFSQAMYSFVFALLNLTLLLHANDVIYHRSQQAYQRQVKVLILMLVAITLLTTLSFLWSQGVEMFKFFKPVKNANQVADDNAEGNERSNKKKSITLMINKSRFLNAPNPMIFPCTTQTITNNSNNRSFLQVQNIDFNEKHFVQRNSPPLSNQQVTQIQEQQTKRNYDPLSTNLPEKMVNTKNQRVKTTKKIDYSQHKNNSQQINILLRSKLDQEHQNFDLNKYILDSSEPEILHPHKVKQAQQST